MTPALQEYVQQCVTLVDAALDRWLPRPPQCPQPLSDALRYSVFAGGKRLRPVLTLAAAEASSDAPDRGVELALPAACALEMIHTYSLIHDDLPAMDNDTLRRGRATSHVVYGEAVAILAGDGLVTEAFALMAREPQGTDPAVVQRKLRALARVATAAGVEGMVGGQVLDLEAQRLTPQLNASSSVGLDTDRTTALQAMHARKTGALIRAAAVSGAIIAGASPEVEGAIDDYATDVGLAFQIVDDVLDVAGGSGSLGKTAGKDEAAGKLTYPSLYGVEGSRRLAVDHIDRARTRLRDAGLKGWLDEIAVWVRDRDA